jgi:hypothetical protein
MNNKRFPLKLKNEDGDETMDTMNNVERQSGGRYI